MRNKLRKKYLKQINLIFFILSTITALFLVSAFYVWWEERGQKETKEVEVLLKFSDKFILADETRAYAYGGQRIHDIESYPSVKKTFFTEAVAIPTRQTIKTELEELNTVSKEATEEGKNHVFSTSYYIGNLLVLPELTLHELLLSLARPKTTELIEMALADLRAGLVKIQDYYDVAPPALYSQSTTSALYFTTPSFPSLTVGEASMVFLIMGMIDEKNARHYENQARLYATQVYLTGAHFKSDIAYSIVLAELYLDIMQSDPVYRKLIAEARLEWNLSNQMNVVSKLSASPLFKFKQFPYATNVTIAEVKNYDYAVSYSNEELSGSIMLTLVDKRLPDPSLRLYQLQVKSGTILPFALDLQLGEALKAKEVIGLADYEDADTFTFVTGAKKAEGDVFAAKTATVFLKDGAMVKPLTTAGNFLPTFTYLDRVKFIKSAQKLIASETVLSSEQKVISEKISVGKVKDGLTTISEDFATGTSPTFLPEDTVLYVESGMIKAKTLSSKEVISVVGINNQLADLISRQIKYFPQQKILVTTDIILDQSTFTPRTLIGLYSLNREVNNLVASPYYMFTINDVVTQSVALSPAGRYLALGITESMSRRAPKLLLFDTFDGIIKEEIDLSSFNSDFVLLDGWLAF